MSVFTVRSSLVLAGGIIGVALVAAGAEVIGLVDDHLGSRIAMAYIGVVLALYGNEIPKRFTPSAASGGDPARHQRVQRIAGWAITLGGLGHVLAWLFAPFDAAAVVGMIPVAASVAITGAAWFWPRAGVV